MKKHAERAGSFTEKEFLITISSAGENYSITMKSILPENTISYQTALNCLQKNQPELIKAFSDSEGNFNSEIRLRVIVKNQKSYWFVGFAREDKVKALLVDGATGNVLAVREIF